jgi:DNA-binding IclR family transcriptional regulator
VLESVVKACNETTYVAIMKDFYSIYLDAVETDMTVRVVTRVGSRLPAYCSAAGKVQIAFMKEDELDNYIRNNEFRQYTKNTITDGEVLRKQLKQVAEQGYAIDDEELDLGVKCVSAPIRDYTRRIVGAVSISGPSIRFSEERMQKELIPLVIAAAAEISAKFGFQK